MEYIWQNHMLLAYYCIVKQTNIMNVTDWMQQFWQIDVWKFEREILHTYEDFNEDFCVESIGLGLLLPTCGVQHTFRLQVCCLDLCVVKSMNIYLFVR